MQLIEQKKECCGACDTCPEVQSPCIRLCRLGKNSICEGCFRSIEEISNWANMTQEQKAATVAQAALRKADAESEASAELINL